MVCVRATKNYEAKKKTITKPKNTHRGGTCALPLSLSLSLSLSLGGFIFFSPFEHHPKTATTNKQKKKKMSVSLDEVAFALEDVFTVRHMRAITDADLESCQCDAFVGKALKIELTVDSRLPDHVSVQHIRLVLSATKETVDDIVLSTNDIDISPGVNVIRIDQKSTCGDAGLYIYIFQILHLFVFYLPFGSILNLVVCNPK